MRFHNRCALLFVACCLSAGAPVRAQDSVTARPSASASFWQAVAGVTTVNWVTWAYNWYLQRWPWAKVGTQSWGRNLREGFAWDNDCFLDNQLAHPYHGSFYHGSARASGYGFWSAVPLVAAGSATWELFGENITASLNDLINTTLGGIALGEVTYRLSSLLGSRRASGSNGIGRELGAFALSPTGRTQALLRGIGHPSGPESGPGEVAIMSLGRRDGRTFVELSVRSGSAFDAEAMRPYDAFEFRLQVSRTPGTTLRAVAISGLLARATLGQSARSHSVLGLVQHYTYEDLSVLQWGEQGVSGALLHQRRLGERNRLELEAHLEGVLLGAISSDHGFEWRRSYDLGPGIGVRLGGRFSRDGRDWVRLEGRTLWLHSLHGSEGDHVATQVRLAATLPVSGALGLGGDLAVTTRHSSYPDFPAVRQRVPEVRAYLTWAP